MSCNKTIYSLTQYATQMYNLPRIQYPSTRLAATLSEYFSRGHRLLMYQSCSSLGLLHPLQFQIYRFEYIILANPLMKWVLQIAAMAIDLSVSGTSVAPRLARLENLSTKR